MFRISARCRSVCPCFTWCAFPLQLSIHLRLFSHLVGRIKHSNTLFLPFYCKRTTSFKSRNINFLDLRNPADVSGNLKCLAATKNLTWCSPCWLWAVGLLRAAVLTLLGMQAGHSQKVNRTSSYLEKWWGGVAIYIVTDLSITCWYHLIRREKKYYWVVFFFILNCSTVETQDNCQGFHQRANDQKNLEACRFFLTRLPMNYILDRNVHYAYMQYSFVSRNSQQGLKISKTLDIYLL